jgi:hypothetical protein
VAGRLACYPMYATEMHMYQLGHAGALNFSMCQSRRSAVFGSLFELKIGLFDLSLQLHTNSDHSLHILTILIQLYRLIYGMLSHPGLWPT